MELTQFKNIYKNKTVLVTGHTGFKGTWLCLWLELLGAKIIGYSLPLTEKNKHFQELNINIENHYGDLNDISFLNVIVQQTKPDLVFHLAAQALVRESYVSPIQTFQTNLMGSLQLYDVCSRQESVKAIINVTTDKVYQNNEWCWGYRENDRLGGNDPYSASKACVEIMSESYRKSFLKDKQTLLATARAGNVIGGGDWADNRLIPDIMRAYQSSQVLHIRNPKAVRPWQHVLEPLSGYLLLGQYLLEGKSSFAESWNLAPALEDTISVQEVLNKVLIHFSDLKVEYGNSIFAEAQMLKLDCSKAKQQMLWNPIWDINKSIELSILWYKAYLDNKKILSKEQLHQYIADARQKNATWITKILKDVI